MRGRRGVPPSAAGFMLLMQLAQRIAQLENKPPVTISLIGLQVAAFFVLLPDHGVGDLCLWPDPELLHRLSGEEAISRLLGSAVVHLDEVHLGYNMLSLLWKGTQLEGRMGSGAFLGLIAVLLPLTQVLMALAAPLLDGAFGLSLSHICVAGFSGVLFALKYILNVGPGAEDTQQVYGFRVPSGLAAWAELAVIQLLVPRSSALGHGCGIVAGALWLHGGQLIARITRGAPPPLAPQQPHPLRPPAHSGPAAGLDAAHSFPGVGHRLHASPDTAWACRTCTFINTGSAASSRVDCAMCGAARS
jgi:rhomboid domain-containing protein 1